VTAFKSMTTKKGNPVPKKKGATIKDLDLKKAKGKAAACDPKGGGGGKPFDIQE
jgi:hypothetical protein